MVLSALVGELCLQKKIAGGDGAGAIGGGQGLADSGFKVMLPLVGSVDGPKTGAQGKFGEGGATVFFPRGAVEKIGLRHRFHCATKGSNHRGHSETHSKVCLGYFCFEG